MAFALEEPISVTSSEPQSCAAPPNGHAALYVNYFEVGHNPFEFLIELGQFHPGQQGYAGGIAIHTRIATAPSYAKMLAALLGRAVREHEAAHGIIPALDDPATPFDIVLRSLPEFEQRAQKIRTGPANGPHPDPSDDR